MRPYMRLLVEDTTASEPCGLCARFPSLYVLVMLAGGMERALHMHMAKQRLMLDGALQSRIAATILGLAAAIARGRMAAWTREALATRRDRQAGVHSACNVLSAHGCCTSGCASRVTPDTGADMGGSQEGAWYRDGDEVERGVDAGAVRLAS